MLTPPLTIGPNSVEAVGEAVVAAVEAVHRNLEPAVKR